MITSEIELKKAKKELSKVEEKLSKYRTSTIIDGFGTQKFAKKSRNWDYYSRHRIILTNLIDDYENSRANNK